MMIWYRTVFGLVNAELISDERRLYVSLKGTALAVMAVELFSPVINMSLAERFLFDEIRIER